MKSMIPIVMAGIGPIYGLVVAVLITGGGFGADYSLFKGAIDLGAGISVGMTGIAAGYAIGVCGDAGVRMSAQNSRGFVAMIQALGFAGALGLCGLITALTLTQNAKPECHSVCYNPCCHIGNNPGTCAEWVVADLAYKCAVN
jgi:V-type H+-transporting ATPase proteolipid subunit